MVKILRSKDRETGRERERGRGKKSESDVCEVPIAIGRVVYSQQNENKILKWVDHFIKKLLCHSITNGLLQCSIPLTAQGRIAIRPYNGAGEILE